MMPFHRSLAFSSAQIGCMFERLPVRLSAYPIARLLDMLYMSYQFSMSYRAGRLLHACIHTYMHAYDIIFSVMFHVKHLYI